VGEHAGVVRGRMSRQRQERRNNVGAVGPGDTAGDRHQQPAAPAEAAAGHTGDGQPHESVGAAHCPHCECHHVLPLSFLSHSFPSVLVPSVL